MQTDDGRITKLAMKLLMPDVWQVTATVEWSDPSEAPDGGDRVRERTIHWGRMMLACDGSCDRCELSVAHVEHDYARHTTRAKGVIMAEGFLPDVAAFRSLVWLAGGKTVEVELTERQREPELPLERKG